MAHPVPAHITGTVWKIEKQVGDTVEEGDVIIILESMKMEIPLTAPVSGRVAKLHVAEGDSVAQGAVAAEIDA